MTVDITYAIRSLIVTDGTLFNLVGGRIYPQPIPITKVYPLISYSQVSDDTISAHTGNSNLANTRIQLDVFADTDALLTTLRDELKRRLRDFKGTVTIGLDSVRIDRLAWANDVRFVDPELQKPYRAIDLLCWHSTTY
jgi:hypothetical protein